MYQITKKMKNGLVLAFVIAIAGILTAQLPFIQDIGFSSITIAIVIGIVVGNLSPNLINRCSDGLQFSKGRLLRLGIIFYGFHLTFQEIMNVGMNAFISDVVIVSGTFFFTLLVGKYVFKLEPQTLILIGSGSSICGAAAVLATEPVIEADSSKVAIAIGTVVIYGTIAMFLYPIMYELHLFPFTAEEFGIYIGSSVHEVGQVYAAGASIGQDIADIAVTTKMMRVMMLAPFLILLSIYLSNKKNEEKNAKMEWSNITIPWFAILFILATAFNSLDLLAVPVKAFILLVDNAMLTMAMAALGLTTNLLAIKKAGLKPLLLGFVVFIWLITVGAGLQLFLA